MILSVRFPVMLVIIYTLALTLAWQCPISAQQQEKGVIVKIFLSDECVISKYYMPLLRSLHEEHIEKDIRFEGIFPNLASKPDKIDAFGAKYEIAFPLRTDYYKKQCQKYGATKVPEVVIVNELDDILYKGRIDNSYHQLGRRRRVITSHDLRDALDAIVSGQPISVKETEVIGCFINYSDL